MIHIFIKQSSGCNMDLHSWSLDTETGAPSCWTWSAPAAGPAPLAGDARWTAPNHCRYCLWEEETERERDGLTDRKGEKKGEKEKWCKQGRMVRRKGRTVADVGWVDTGQQLGFRGGFYTIHREAGEETCEFKRELAKTCRKAKGRWVKV